jgi:hypothetical protein
MPLPRHGLAAGIDRVFLAGMVSRIKAEDLML